MRLGRPQLVLLSLRLSGILLERSEGLLPEIDAFLRLWLLRLKKRGVQARRLPGRYRRGAGSLVALFRGAREVEEIDRVVRAASFAGLAVAKAEEVIIIEVLLKDIVAEA